jgi:Holliday junction resolvase
MRSHKLSPGELGHGFEERVKRIFESNGYAVVKKNQWKTNYAFEKDKAKKREYDLVMFNMREKQFYIIECKAHYEPSTYVRFEQVNEFNRKLRNYNGMSAVRMMVSDTDFTSAARGYAYKNNILLINIRELRRMENQGGIGKTIAVRALSSGLEGFVSRIISNYSKRNGGG